MRSKFNKFLTLLAVLLFGISNVWGANVTLFSTDFSDASWSGATFSQGNTTTPDVINGITFYAKNSDGAKNFSISDGKLIWPNNNIASSNYFLGIPVSNVNGTITVTVQMVGVSGKKASVKYVISDGAASVSTPGGTGTQAQAASNGTGTITFTSTTLSNVNKKAVVYLGRYNGNTENNNVMSITITTPAPAATYDATFADGGHGTAPDAATGVSSVTLTEITGVDGWKNTGWTADKATKVGTTDKAAGAHLDNGATVTLLENTTFTAEWAELFSVTYDANGASGTAPTEEDHIAGEKFNIAGQGSLVTPASKAFGGWEYSSTTYAPTTEFTMPSGDVTFTAIWNDVYSVTYKANNGTAEADIVVDNPLTIATCSFTAPAGKAFKEWTTNADGSGTKYKPGDAVSTTLELYAQWKAAPQVLFHYQWTGSGTQPSVDDVLNGTGGTITVERKEGSTKTLSNESATFKSTVPADMRFTGSTSKGIKFGTSDVYFHIALTSGKFEEGDTIRICGYESFLVSSTSTSSAGTGDISSGFATGANNSNYDTASCVIPAITPSDLYVRRTSSSAGFAAIKVIRPVKYAVNFAAGEGTGTMTAKAYPATAEVTLPECTFTPPTDKEFDAWTSSDVTISAGKFTMPANDVTITATWKAETPKYDITYYPGTGGSGSIDPAKKTKDVDFVLSSERFTRAGYLQTGWATADGGAKVYELGATYTENADLDLYPFWTELDTYVASFSCATTPSGWTFSNAGFGADNVATAAYVCTFVDNGISTPLQAAAAGKDGTTENDVAFAKNTSAIATYDLGITTTVAAINVVLNGGSGSPFDETIELVGADGTTVKQSYVTSLNAGNWNDNTISKTDVVADVRYIRVHGASKWVVMKSFSVSYIETRTKYDVAFAAGTGASGTMPTLHYAEGAGVVLPAATFTPPTDKEFDAWTSSDVTITDGKFTMPASDVTVTATWKDAITRYDVTFETNGGSTIDAQEVEENGHPTAVADPTKANYVFVGWFNNSDLAPEHAVADITALTITDDITLYAKWQLDIRLRQLVFSNGFDAFIKNNEVKAYYMEGTSAPTMVSYQGVNLKDVADAVTIVGNKVRMVGTDDSVIELDLTLEAVTPMSSYDKQIFDGTETYVKTGNAFSTTSGKLGWKFSKNDDDWSRETPGQNRIYFFVGGSADRATFTSGASSRAIKVYVNNELVSSVETTAAAGSTFDIPLPAANAYNMIAIISNQTSGDGSVTDIQLNEHVISTDVSLSSLTVNGTAIDLQDGVYTYNFELPYGTVDAPTVVAVANAAPYATVSAITVDGTTKATFTVTAESSATQDYVVNFSIARFPTIYLWDGSTMSALSDITAAATAAGVAVTTTGISVTSFSAKTCEENGKSYTKALDFGGKTQASRNFGIEIPAGKVAKVSLVYRAKSTSRSIMIATALSDAVDESTITSKDAVDASNLYIMTADMFGGGTLYINTTDGFHVHEISIQLAEGHGRSAMLGNGVLGTVCVPNNVAIEDIQGATFYELAGREPEHGKLAFDEITSGELEAGVPYLFQAKGNHIALLYGATHVDNPVDKHNGMYGTFTDITLTELTDVYYFAQKALWGCSDLTSLSVPANRAYVKLSEIDYLSDPNPAPGRRRILMGVNGENQATGFENIESGDAPMKVMIDGTLYILRGEKVFDATGRLVK